MEALVKHPNLLRVYQEYDPTHTLTLRDAFAGRMIVRFNELARVVKKSVDDEDCFGLRMEQIKINQMETTGTERFAYGRSSRKINDFMNWLRIQIENGIISTISLDQVGDSVDAAWTNMYVSDSYKRGLLRARSELIKAGMDVPPIEPEGGIELALNNPFHIDRLGLLYTRVYSELQGITQAMDSIISRVLAQGMADGDGPALLARKLVASINGSGLGDLGIKDSLGRFIPAERRAEMMARTEVIRAHHQATIQEYMNWRLEKVFILAEVVTAGDRRVCDKCNAMAKGGPYTLEEALGLIPNHTSCRCCAIPYIEPKMKR